MMLVTPRPMTCPIYTGVFLVRACGAPATGTCERCQRQVCDSHSKTQGAPLAERVRCTDCLRGTGSSSRNRDRDDDAFLTGAIVGSSSTESGSEPLTGEGGEFGGAGASGTWDDAGAAAPGDTDPAAFTPADFAAFDAISDSDKDQGSPGYDS